MQDARPRAEAEAEIRGVGVFAEDGLEVNGTKARKLLDVVDAVAGEASGDGCRIVLDRRPGSRGPR